MTLIRTVCYCASILAASLFLEPSRAGAEDRPLSIEIYMAVDTPTKGATEVSFLGTKKSAYILGKPILTTADIAELRLSKNMGKNLGGTLVLKEDAAKKLLDAVAANPQKQWATLFDGKVVNSFMYPKTSNTTLIAKWPLANGGITHEQWNEFAARGPKPVVKPGQK